MRTGSYVCLQGGGARVRWAALWHSGSSISSTERRAFITDRGLIREWGARGEPDAGTATDAGASPGWANQADGSRGDGTHGVGTADGSGGAGKGAQESAGGERADGAARGESHGSRRPHTARERLASARARQHGGGSPGGKSPPASPHCHTGARRRPPAALVVGWGRLWARGRVWALRTHCYLIARGDPLLP